MSKTRRSGDEGQNFEETTDGEKPHSTGASVSAKGELQLDFKRYFGDEGLSAEEFAEAFTAHAAALSKRGWRVAGYIPQAVE